MAMSTREIGAYKEIKITLLNKKLKTNGLKVILAYYRINRLFEKELKGDDEMINREKDK